MKFREYLSSLIGDASAEQQKNKVGETVCQVKKKHLSNRGNTKRAK